MSTEVNLKIELQVPSQRILEHLVLHNEQIEKEIEEGVNAAIAELSKEGSIAIGVKAAVTKAVIDSINKSVYSWKIENMVNDMMKEKIGAQIDKYAEVIAETVKNQLNLK